MSKVLQDVLDIVNNNQIRHLQKHKNILSVTHRLLLSGVHLSAQHRGRGHLREVGDLLDLGCGNRVMNDVEIGNIRSKQ